MKRKVFSFLLMMLAVVGVAYAQMPQFTPLPLKAGVKSGKLPNGLTYYVLHNEEPKDRANFYIAQKVGSTLENPDQLGLAHFLEHMAFNGTKTYPGKNLLNYLQSKGIRFGADINAYTGFDETVYNIDNVPTADVALMDSVLLALRDWSCNILLEETEIDAERGVIQEEWRSRNDAGTRMYTKLLPELYDEYQYEQMPIGSMDVVMNFKPQAIRDYYHKWYRPDQQGIIIVGDFDADVMEKKVIELFSQIPMPENAAERTYPTVSDNAEPIYATYEDPELQNAMVTVAFKYEKVPFEYRNTQEIYITDGLVKSVMAQLLNNRLNEFANDPACNYIVAQARFGDYYVSKTKGAFQIVIIPKDQIQPAFDDAMSIVARACKTGFTNSELERVDSELLSVYEKLYNERDKTKTGAIAQELIRNFIDNEPAPGIEVEYEIIKNVLPELPAEFINQFAATLLTPQNQVVVVSQPKVEGKSLPAKEAMLADLQNILNAQYEAYVDEVITDPLIAKLPKPGKVKSEKQNAEFGTTELTLSNGVKVVVKPTDFAADEIVMTMFREGGKVNYSVADAPYIQLIEDAYDASKFGTFDQTKLKKYLAGKRVSLGMQVGLRTLAFDGNSTVKDLPTLLELLYTSFTDLNPDQEKYDTEMNNARSILATYGNNPQYVFQSAVKNAKWGNNPVMDNPTIATIDAGNYTKELDLIKKATANAANYTMVITGNVNIDELRPLLCQYVASLPSTGKKDKVEVLNPIAIPAGNVNKNIDIEMQTPAVMIYEDYTGEGLAYDVKNDVILTILAGVLDNNFTTTLREEEGGTYGAQVASQILPSSGQWELLYVFQTNQEMAQKLIDRAHKETLELLANGTNATEFNKVKEAELAQFDINMRDNKQWNELLMNYERGYNLISGRRDFIKNLTLDDFNRYIAGIYKGNNRIQVVLDGKPGK